MRDPRLFLQDILDSWDRVERFIGSISLEDFTDDEKTLSAIRDQDHDHDHGQAVKHIPEEMKAKYQEIPWDEIAGMRDVLIMHISELMGD